MNRHTPELEHVEVSLEECFERVRVAQPPAPDRWSKVRARIEAEAEAASARGGRDGSWWRSRRWAAGGGLAASLLLLSLLFVTGPGGNGGMASAEEVLLRAQTAIAEPADAGVEHLAITQEIQTMPLGDGGEITEGEQRLWYQAPDRQRIEIATGTPTEMSMVLGWDGDDYWRYSPREGTATVWRQDPEAAVYQQGVVLGGSPGIVPGDLVAEHAEAGTANRYVLECRSATVMGEERIAGRTADVIELGRTRCGVPWPGQDGRATLWVDRETGLVLQSELYAAGGDLFQRSTVTELTINEPIEQERFSVVLPSDTEVNDLRDPSQPHGGAGARFASASPSISLEEAREAATFTVQTPSAVPDGFELESVEHHWMHEGAREHNSHADWVLLRYVDGDGNWLAITQGFPGGGAATLHLAEPPPPAEHSGTVEVDGATAHWVDGFGHPEDWQPGVMRSLAWQAATMGTSPYYISLASNVLSLDELVSVAESLE